MSQRDKRQLVFGVEPEAGRFGLSLARTWMLKQVQHDEDVVTAVPWISRVHKRSATPA
jgi:hypothetical protein